MKKIYILSTIWMAFIVGACDYNDKNFDGLDDIVKPANVVKEKYTLVEADYAAISDNSTNKSIAKKEGTDKALAAVKTDLYLNETVPGPTYLPAFLAAKYFTADEGSSVKVTYSYRENKSELLSAYSSIKSYKAGNKDYRAAHGNAKFVPYLNENTKNKVADLLINGYEEPEEGDVVLVEYRYNAQSNNTLETPQLWENFEDLGTGNLTRLKDWGSEKDWFVSSTGGTQWKVTAYNNNQYIQYSAYKTEGECEAWMVTPEMTVGADDKLSFDVCVGNWNADCLTVWISEDFDGKDVKKATWTDITSHFTIPSAPAKGYGSFASAGTFPLAQYGGKKVFVAFKYLGDGVNKKTTTYQIDNVMIGSKIPEGEGLKADVAFDLKVFDGKKWNNADKNVLVLSVQDYKEMGQNQYCFSEKVSAADYLPNYLAKVIAYPVDQENRVVVYRYNNGKEVKNYSDEYTYSAATGRWTLNTRIVDLTQQYVFAGGVWKFDPSMTITLEAVKGNAESAAFYQAIVDYVGKTFGSDYYQTGYTNAEFYYGASSYQNNFSFYPYSWRESNKAGAAAYQHLSDEELTALMFERLPEAVRIGLEAIYSDADVVTGVEVTYTVNFSIYGINGTKDTTVYTVKYVVTGKAEFEYVEDSLKAIG